MKITLIQAIVIFWSSLILWVLVEYLFYRLQNSQLVLGAAKKLAPEAHKQLNIH